MPLAKVDRSHEIGHRSRGSRLLIRLKPKRPFFLGGFVREQKHLEKRGGVMKMPRAEDCLKQEILKVLKNNYKGILRRAWISSHANENSIISRIGLNEMEESGGYLKMQEELENFISFLQSQDLF